jgi:hypothetical protein
VSLSLVESALRSKFALMIEIEYDKLRRKTLVFRSFPHLGPNMVQAAKMYEDTWFSENVVMDFARYKHCKLF